MAFWGVEVKPGKPFAHTADDGRGRLHLSQATLGIGSAANKSVVQCNVGSKSPVFLCSLLPDKSESCQLNLEFEEADEVVFSVVGPRSVHLTGYFIASSRHHHLGDESESYGEDIAETEPERSSGCSDEDEYEDSFIDDSEPKSFAPSPFSDDGVTEETLHRKKAKNGKASRRRLKYKSIESDNDSGAQQRMLVNSTAAGAALLDSDTEDVLPISSLCKGDPTKSRKLEAEGAVNENDESNLVTKREKFEVEQKDDEKNGETNNVESKDDAAVNGESERGDNLQHLSEQANWVSPKKKSEDWAKGENTLEADSIQPPMDIRNDETLQDELKAEDVGQDIAVAMVNEQNQKQANDKNDETLQDELKAQDIPVAVVNEQNQKQANDNEVGAETDVKPKKRKKRKQGEAKIQQDEVNSDSMSSNLPMGIEQIEKQANDNQSEEKKKKKKKKRKIQEDGKDMLSIADEKDGNAGNKSSQLRTLSGGLTIEELETGKPDGKVATSGKKVSIIYIGKLKENGQVFDSNLEGTPFKFRVGKKDIIDGLNIGLEGMRVGEKRRLVIPPSMGYGSEGDGQSVPPNSWLVYDVELVKVR